MSHEPHIALALQVNHMVEADLKEKLACLRTASAAVDFILENIPASLKKFRAVLDDKK